MHANATNGTHGYWLPDRNLGGPMIGLEGVRAALMRLNHPVHIVMADGSVSAGVGGAAVLGQRPVAGESYPVHGYVSALPPETLGDPGFRATHGVKYNYVAGEMANAIGSEEIVEAMARCGCIGFFGSAGCSTERVEKAITRIKGNIGNLPFGFNLIHSPGETGMEDANIDLYLKHGVRTICASAFMDLTLPMIRYRVSGIRTDERGNVVTPNHLFAKISREEVATKFFSPPPAEMLATLVQKGVISEAQAKMAEKIPVAEDMTAEADSGGHTDNRPAITLIPAMLALRDRLAEKFNYDRPLRVGAAGGIATPWSVMTAFAMGADYVLTGSINQACVEAGTSDFVRDLLLQATQVDVIMGPAADMFEMGVNVQVLKRGTMFAMRARKLYELYKAHNRIEDIPPATKAQLEKDFFRKPLEEIWNETADFFKTRDPKQLEVAARDPKHKLALIFRWYLGRSSKWANTGDATRKLDYQIWCGPAMGAFNSWAKGSFLEDPEQRTVAQVARNLLEGASVVTRAQQLRSYGAPVPAEAFDYRPRVLG